MSTISTENQSNHIALTVNNNRLIKENFRKREGTQEWIDFGTIEIESPQTVVSIENLEDTSLYVDHLLFIPIEKYAELKEEYNQLLKSYKIVKADETLDRGQLGNKSVSVLSNSYSPYWNICGKDIFRVNFYAVGSQCDKKNIYPTFTPESLHTFALVASLVLHIGVIGALLRLSRRI